MDIVGVDVSKVRGKMAEYGYTITSMSTHLGISRNTLTAYLDNPSRMPYGVISNMASVLCDTPEEASNIFFASNLRKT